MKHSIINGIGIYTMDHEAGRDSRKDVNAFVDFREDSDIIYDLIQQDSITYLANISRWKGLSRLRERTRYNTFKEESVPSAYKISGLPNLDELDYSYGWYNPYTLFSETDAMIGDWVDSLKTVLASKFVFNFHGVTAPHDHVVLMNTRKLESWQKAFFRQLRSTGTPRDVYVYCPCTKAQYAQITSMITGMEHDSPFIGLFDL